MHLNKVTILDGSFTFQLFNHTEKAAEGDPLWSSRYLYTDPESVLLTHLDYMEAGSQIIETNTYQASVEGFMEHLNLTEEESISLIKKAVLIAKNARDRFLLSNPDAKSPLIAGSMGPYGAYLHDASEYSGTYVNTTSIDTIRKFHKRKMEALIEAGVDLLAFETIPCKPEAEILLNLLKEYPNIKAWISFTAKDEKCIAKGDNFQETAKFCYNSNPDQLLAVGINCTDPAYIEPLFKGIHNGERQPIPLIVYPNSGEKYKPGVGWTGKENCKPMSSYVKTWLDLGVVYIGGCCRVCASDIKGIVEEVRKWEESNRSD